MIMPHSRHTALGYGNTFGTYGYNKTTMGTFSLIAGTQRCYTGIRLVHIDTRAQPRVPL